MSPEFTQWLLPDDGLCGSYGWTLSLQYRWASAGSGGFWKSSSGKLARDCHEQAPNRGPGGAIECELPPAGPGINVADQARVGHRTAVFRAHGAKVFQLVPASGKRTRNNAHFLKPCLMALAKTAESPPELEPADPISRHINLNKVLAVGRIEQSAVSGWRVKTGALDGDQQKPCGDRRHGGSIGRDEQRVVHFINSAPEVPRPAQEQETGLHSGGDSSIRVGMTTVRLGLWFAVLPYHVFFEAIGQDGQEQNESQDER